MRFSFPRRVGTLYIHLDPSRCQACWDCVQACPQGVLGKIDLPFHRHARIDQADNCKGCLLCVDVCSHQAILTTEKTS